MTPKRFAALAESHGSRLDRWPDDQRDAAYAHLLAHPDAQAVLEQQQRLDHMLAAWSTQAAATAVSPFLATRIAAAVQRRDRLQPWLSGLGATAVLAAGAIAGILAVGLSSGAPEDQPRSVYGLTVLGAPLADMSPAP